MQKQQQSQIMSTIIASKDQLLTNSASLNTTYSKVPAACTSNGKKLMNVTFTFAPEWNLNKKDSNIQLLEPLGALEYLVNMLDLDFKNELSSTASSNVGLNTTYKTPSKRLASNADKLSTKKIDLSEKKSLNKTINLSASSSKQSMKF
jgi:hypothetical protein